MSQNALTPHPGFPPLSPDGDRPGPTHSPSLGGWGVESAPICSQARLPTCWRPCHRAEARGDGGVLSSRVASPQGFSRGARGCTTWGSDQTGVGGWTRDSRAWMVNEGVSEGAALGADPPVPASTPPGSQSQGHLPGGERWSLERVLQRDTSRLRRPCPDPAPGTLQSPVKLQGVCPHQGTPYHTRWEGLAADSFWCGASEVTQDQRSKFLGAELFSDFGGRMSQPSRQCCGEQRVRAPGLGQVLPPNQCLLQTETLRRQGPVSIYWVALS